MNIEIIAGSPRVPSLNARAAQYLLHYLRDNCPHQIGLIAVNQLHLPFVQEVWTSPEKAPEAFSDLARRMFQADAFIICSPEYNGGYSPAMKNLFDHFPKQAKKAFGLCTTSDGAMGGMRAAQQLLQLVPALFGVASPNLLIVPKANEVFSPEGQLMQESFQQNVHNFCSSFLWLAEAIYSARH